ncbi:acyl carrier protein [Candidatus Pseudothioglobus singularis]|nr:acyl carrier protein [Candidatus Pseudothioglobus singularis]
MSENINYKKIKSIIESVIKKELLQDQSLLDDGVLDSLMTLNLIEELEKSFSISIATDEFSHFNFNSVMAINKMITRVIN